MPATVEVRIAVSLTLDVWGLDDVELEDVAASIVDEYENPVAFLLDAAIGSDDPDGLPGEPCRWQIVAVLDASDDGESVEVIDLGEWRDA